MKKLFLLLLLSLTAYADIGGGGYIFQQTSSGSSLTPNACLAGQFASGIGSGGTLTCGTPASGITVNSTPITGGTSLAVPFHKSDNTYGEADIFYSAAGTFSTADSVADAKAGALILKGGTNTGAGANADGADVELRPGNSPNEYPGQTVIYDGRGAKPFFIGNPGSGGNQIYAPVGGQTPQYSAAVGGGGRGDASIYRGMRVTSDRVNFYASNDSNPIVELYVQADGGSYINTNLTLARHLVSSATAPTVSSCGVSPSISGSDVSGSVTVGTGGVATSCLITFAATWNNAPHCFANDKSEIVQVTFSATSTTTATLSKTTPFAASSVIDYFCVSN